MKGTICTSRGDGHLRMTKAPPVCPHEGNGWGLGPDGITAFYTLAVTRWAMPSHSEDHEQPFASTTWRFERVKITPPPQRPASTPAAGRRWWLLSRRNPRDPLTITVKYRGGSQAWYEIHARGSVGRFHGATALHDVIAEINAGGSRDRPT